VGVDVAQARSALAKLVASVVFAAPDGQREGKQRWATERSAPACQSGSPFRLERGHAPPPTRCVAVSERSIWGCPGTPPNLAFTRVRGSLTKGAL
jgi:hypothetical protein